MFQSNIFQNLCLTYQTQTNTIYYSMKKLALISAAILTSIGIYAADSMLKPKEPTKENTQCNVCENGVFKFSGKTLIFEIDSDGSELIHTTNSYKCDHCQSLTQDKELKNGYFSMSFPK